MSAPDSSPRPTIAAVLATLEASVADRGHETATVTHESDNGIDTITVTPRNAKAATVLVQIAGDDSMLLTFGRTSVQITDTPERQLEQLRETLKPVLEGAFVEFGPGYGQSQLRLNDGSKLRVGAEKSPLQRRFGPKHRYEPYD